MTVLPNNADFALPKAWADLVGLGFSVIPMRHHGKTPLVKWKPYQTERADLDTVRQWASRKSNIGIATGAVSGVIVLDLDNQKAIAEAEALGLPDTLAVSTPRGLHVYFRHPGYTLGNRTGIRPGWDIRGDGGYVVTAGSHFIPDEREKADGKVEGSYTWRNPPGLFDLADMPDWLAKILGDPPTARDNDTALPGRASAWAEAALRGELTALGDAQQGKRNLALNNASMKLGQIVAGGHLREGDVKQRLRATAAAIGLNVYEIEPTIDSGFAKGLTEPRHPPESEAKPKRGRKPKGGERSDPETGEVFEVDGDVSEDAIAQAFTARFKDTLRYDHDARAWYEWDGTRWRKDGRERAFNYARELGRILSRGDDGERGLRKASVAAGAEKFARADPAHAVDAGVWDLDTMILGTPGGTVDLKTGKLRKANPASNITKQTAVAPESGEPSIWLAFLREALSGDDDSIRFLQQWAGYCLTGDTREHALAFVYGPGGNGKSVFLNTITAIMGDYAVTAAMETFTASKFDRHSTELAMLAGARLVTASETEENRAWAEAKVKQMTGGDPITARFMHKDNFTFRPQFKLTIAGNYAPALRNVDDAMRRRFNIVPFTVKPAKPDRQLEDKLKAEHGKILAWAIAGCLDWQTNGLMRPAAVTDATADYFDAQDLFGQWIEERCELSANKFELPTPLYNDWCAYAREAGEEPGSAKTFKAALEKRNVMRGKSSGVRSYRGIALRTKGAGGAHGDT